MTEKLPYTVATVFSIVAFVLLLAVVSMTLSNQSKKDDILRAQKEVSTAQLMASLDTNLIRLMAGTAVNHDDVKIRELLAANGVVLGAEAKMTPPPVKE